MNALIYLDHNATTPIDLDVAARVFEVQSMQLMNPASQHRSGQAARRMVEGARVRCLELLAAETRSFPSDQLIFTSGGTESNNLAILGLARKNTQLIVSAVEHPSVMAAATTAGLLGSLIRKIPVDSNGVCDLNSLDQLLSAGPTSLVSLMLVNSETGVIQPVAEAAKLCRSRGVLLHTDAVQAVGKIPVSFRELGVDLLTLTPHKFGGPRSIGALIVRPGVPLAPLMHGGFQQGSMRPGTEDPALAAGFQLALEKATSRQSLFAGQLAAWNQLCLSILRDRVNGPLFVNGGEAPRSPHTLNVSFPGVDRQTLLLAADVAGVAFSTGSACSSGSSETSPVLLAMGLDSPLAESAIRLSFGWNSTPDEIELAASKIADIVNHLRQ